SLFELAQAQAGEAAALKFSVLDPLDFEPLASRWLVYGAYRIDRSRSSMLDTSRAVTGLFHALAAGTAPTLHQLPSEEAAANRRVFREAAGDVEHWFTATGGARVELTLEATSERPLRFDHDYL